MEDADIDPRKAARVRRTRQARSWEHDLVDAVAEHTLEVLPAQWVFVHLRDPSGQAFRSRTETGNRDRVATLSECLPDVEQNTEVSGLSIRIENLRRDSRFAPLAKSFPGTQSLLRISLTNGSNRPEGMIALGFEGGCHGISLGEIEMLERMARHLGTTAHVYRQMTQRLAPLEAEAVRIRESASPRTRTSLAVLTVPAVSGISHGGGNHPARPDYCAVATGQGGDIRLFASNVLAQGVERLWGRLALDVLFRASMVLCKNPAALAAMMSRVRTGAGGNAGCPRLFSCASVDGSGRSYVFAGSASHLLFEHGPQTVSELSERLPVEIDASAPWSGQRVVLRSGDVVVFHTATLPQTLPERHTIHRQIAALLARESRRPTDVIAAKIAVLLRDAGAHGDDESALVLLRAE